MKYSVNILHEIIWGKTFPHSTLIQTSWFLPLIRLFFSAGEKEKKYSDFKM